MTLLTALLVTLLVGAVGAIRSVRRRALVYSLPLPITLVLVTAPVGVDGGQLLGVAGLVLFIAVVALAHLRLGLPVLLADAVGVAVYTGLGLLIASFGKIPFWPVLLAVTALWAAATRLLPPPRADVVAPPPAPRPGPLVKLGAVFGASLLMVALGGLLKGLIVTFPFSGVLVVIETRAHLDAFCRNFLRGSIALVAFFTGHHLFQDHSRALALAAAWASFALCAVLLRLWSRQADGEAPEGAEGPLGTCSPTPET